MNAKELTEAEKIRMLREALDKCGWVLHFAAAMARDFKGDLPHLDKTLLEIKTIMRTQQEALAATEKE